MARYKYKPIRSDKEIRILTLLGDTQSNPDKISCTIHHITLPTSHKHHGSNAGLKGKHAALGNGTARPELPKYEAVSWTWGKGTSNTSIFIVEAGKEEKTVEVRENLIKVLKYLRKTGGERLLWVDAVCINQNNEDEKNQQVAMMADVYGNADSVCIWLGEAAEESDLALDFINNEFSDLGAFEEYTDIKYEPQWRALAALMHRSWFTRRWVVQEISHARKATIQVGKKTMAWSDFESAVSLFEEDAWRISRLFQDSPKARHDPQYFGDVAAMGATRLVRVKNKLFRRNSDRKIIEWRLSLGELVAELSTFHAVLQHDMIYAVLSLAKDTHHRMIAHTGFKPDEKDEPPDDPSISRASTSSFYSTTSAIPDELNANDDGPTSSQPTQGEGGQGNTFTSRQKFYVTETLSALKRPKEAKRAHAVFEVDYNQDFFDVCKLFLEFAINGSAKGYNLDILFWPWAPQAPPPTQDKPAPRKLPSWIPKAADAPFAMRKVRHAPGCRQASRNNHDPLVGNSAGAAIYRACRDLSAQRNDWHFGDPNRADEKESIFVSGFLLDFIEDIGVYSQEGNIPEAWFQIAGWNPRDEEGELKTEAPPEELWRTVVADRGTDAKDTQAYYQKAFEYTLQSGMPGGGVGLSNLATASNAILTQFLNRMKAVVWNRALFRSRREYLGLAPQAATSEDRIVILKGCSVPVVIRPLTAKLDGSPRYKMIGHCYLHTMMDGQAIDIQEEEGIPTQMFEIQ